MAAGHTPHTPHTARRPIADKKPTCRRKPGLKPKRPCEARGRRLVSGFFTHICRQPASSYRETAVPRRRETENSSLGRVSGIPATPRDGKTVSQVCCGRSSDPERRKNLLSGVLRAHSRPREAEKPSLKRVEGALPTPRDGKRSDPLSLDTIVVKHFVSQSCCNSRGLDHSSRHQLQVFRRG